MEDARELAEQLLNDLGYPLMVPTLSEDLYWHGNGYEGETIILDGYVFTYQLGIGNVFFQGVLDDDVLDYQADEGEELYSCRSEVRIWVTDKGIVKVNIYNPVEIVSTTEHVELLALENIEGVLRNEIKERPDEYGIKHLVKANKFTVLELNYMRMKDLEQDGFYSYVPVWCLRNLSVSDAKLYINAIDGSMVQWEEVY